MFVGYNSNTLNGKNKISISSGVKIFQSVLKRKLRHFISGKKIKDFLDNKSEYVSFYYCSFSTYFSVLLVIPLIFYFIAKLC